ncbi:hypothetical protein ACWGMN_21665 [Streptomyces albidoflavus]
MSWDELTELLAGELRRVVDTYGNEAIYGGSYGWASAGRFHHARARLAPHGGTASEGVGTWPRSGWGWSSGWRCTRSRCTWGPWWPGRWWGGPRPDWRRGWSTP